MPGDLPKYYVMSCFGVTPIADVYLASDVPDAPWMDGEVLERDTSKPIVFAVDPDGGNLKAMYGGGVPLMREDLIEALREAGVDNLQLFPAVVRDKKRKKQYTNYKAVNIIGVVACADKEQSAMSDTSDSELIDADFDSLTIDASRTGGALLFRLAEAVSAIVVHEKVRKHVQERGVPGMIFYGPGEWSG